MLFLQKNCIICNFTSAQKLWSVTPIFITQNIFKLLEEIRKMLDSYIKVNRNLQFHCVKNKVHALEFLNA